MTSYILAPEALQDLQELWDYIATENLDAADRVVDTLFAAFERLAAMPGLGHRREDLTDRPLRFWTVDAYLVIYRAERTPIEIVAVTRGGRDIPHLLQHR
jgi:plasmid stabilization system protein ParE